MVLGEKHGTNYLPYTYHYGIIETLNRDLLSW